MSRATDWLYWLAVRMGWPGLSGVVLLLGAASVHLWVLPDMAARTQAMAAEAAALEALRARQTEEPQRVDALDRLTDPRETPEAVGRLFKAASRAGLALDQGEYRLQGGAGGAGLLRYQIVLPAQASYPVLRSFLADALNANPGLALDALDLSRDRVESGELKAMLRFTLYLDAGVAP
ncbi:MAG: hypothetical protein ACUVSD_01125 [Thiobacillaceae bacterium]